MFLNARIAKPKYPATMIDRLRLYRRLDCWQEKRAIIIQAPTGYGKSSLVSRWIDYGGHTSHTAWLTLNEDDSDAHQFAQHLAAALERVIPGALALIQPILADSHGNAERVLTRLFSTYWDEAGSDALPADQHTLLVLDDLHRVQSSEIDATILTILEHGPDNLHLLLMTRRRTTLPLARLYAHESIEVLNAEDMRFTKDEVREYLQRQGYVHPDETDVAQLATRSDGWVTALQLVVLARGGHGSVAELIDMLHRNNIWIAEYLTEEVLNQQTPKLRRFLLHTSILDEFNGDLCAAVTGEEDAYALLAAIARADLFLIQVDEDKRWFRYHHLFQELLQHRLQEQAVAGFKAELHLRAANWLATADDYESALHHYLAAGAEEQATELVEAKLLTTLLRDPYQARRLLTLLPHDLLIQRPKLMLDRCRLALLFDDQSALSYVQEAGHILREMQSSDSDAKRHHAEWLVLQGCSFLISDDLTAAAEAERQARAYLSELDDFHYGTLHFLQMHLHKYKNRRADMNHSAEAALAAFERDDFVIGMVAVRREKARWSMVGGNSDETTRRFQELFEWWDRDQLLGTDEMALAYFFAAENSYWQNRIVQARAYQQLGFELAIQLQDPQLIHTAHYLGQALGLDVAEDSMGMQAFADHLHQVTSPTLSDLIIDYRTLFLIAAGRSDGAGQILQKVGIDLQYPTIVDDFRMLIVALRTTIAQGVDLATITPILAKTLAIAEDNELRYYKLQLLALKAWQQFRLHGAPTAKEALLQAVHLADETGYVRVLCEIPELVDLMKKMGISLAGDTTSADDAASMAFEAVMLTDQEQRVLELLAVDYTYQQIAEELVISINTVRTHVRHIYRKLSAKRRDQAVQQAKLLDLLHDD